jgi:O-antigen/teichoic acid export membrane protein
VTSLSPHGPQAAGAATGRIVASLLWLGSASAFGQVVSWASTVLVIRLLSPDDYGLMAMAVLSIVFLITIGDLGIGAVIVQTPALDRPRLRALFGLTLVTYLAAAVIAFAGAPLMAAFFAEPRLVPLVHVLSGCFVFLALYALPQALMVRALEFDRKARVEMATAIVASVVGIALALTGWGVWALVGAMLAGHATRAVGFQLMRPCLFLPVLSLAEVRGSVHFGSWVTLDRILWFAYTNLDVAIAGRALGGTVLGVYSVALSLASLPLAKVMSLVTEVSFSALSRIQGDRERAARGMLRSLESVSLLAFPSFFGMATLAEELIAVVLGAKWAGAVVPFQILCFAFAFRAVGLLFAPALLAAGKPRLAVENNALTLGGVAVALAIGVQWGVIGLCVGWVVGYIPVFCVTAHRTLRALEIPAWPVARTIGFSLTAAVAMAVALDVVRGVVDATLPPAAALPCLVFLGASVYGVLVLIVRPQVVRPLLMLRGEK